MTCVTFYPVLRHDYKSFRKGGARSSCSNLLREKNHLAGAAERKDLREKARR
jgi:hypothetical protein